MCEVLYFLVYFFFAKVFVNGFAIKNEQIGDRQSWQPDYVVEPSQNWLRDEVGKVFSSQLPSNSKYLKDIAAKETESPIPIDHLLDMIEVEIKDSKEDEKHSKDLLIYLEKLLTTDARKVKVFFKNLWRTIDLDYQGSEKRLRNAQKVKGMIQAIGNLISRFWMKFYNLITWNSRESKEKVTNHQPYEKSFYDEGKISTPEKETRNHILHIVEIKPIKIQGEINVTVKTESHRDQHLPQNEQKEKIGQEDRVKQKSKPGIPGKNIDEGSTENEHPLKEQTSDQQDHKNPAVNQTSSTDQHITEMGPIQSESDAVKRSTKSKDDHVDTPPNKPSTAKAPTPSIDPTKIQEPDLSSYNEYEREWLKNRRETNPHFVLPPDELILPEPKPPHKSKLDTILKPVVIMKKLFTGELFSRKTKK